MFIYTNRLCNKSSLSTQRRHIQRLAAIATQYSPGIESPILVAARSKHWACACSDWGFESRRSHECLCCVLYSKDNGTSTEKVQRGNKRRNSENKSKKKNPGRGKIFRTRPDRRWGPPSLLYNGGGVSFQRERRPGRGVNHPPPSSAEVQERIEVYLYSPFGPSVCSRVIFTF